MEYVFARLGEDVGTVGVLVEGSDYEKLEKKMRKFFAIRGWEYVGGFKQVGTENLYYFPIVIRKRKS